MLEFIRRLARQPARESAPPKLDAGTRKLAKGQRILLRTLMGTRGQMFTVSELAGLMGCSIAEASRRVKAAAGTGYIRCECRGRRKYTRLANLTWPVYRDLADTVRQ